VKKRKRRGIEEFSVSFLDVICCGFGAIILLLMITKTVEPILLEESQVNLEGVVADRENALFEIRGQVRELTRQVTDSEAELPSGRVPANSTLLVFFAAANHDETQFIDAERFDVGRSLPGHVAFGHGIHYCLGASLARLEGRVAFEVLLGRCRKMELAADAVPMLDSLVLRGPKSLSLRVEME